ncbi:MAG: acyl-CoA dehydrogenase FadE [Nevskia sp.]
MAYWLLFFLVSIAALAWTRPGIRTTSLVLGAVTLFYGAFGGHWLLFLIMMITGALVLVPLNLAVLRQEWLSRPLFASFKRIVSRLDERQLAAIAGGGAGWEAELFNGQPDWPRFHADYNARVTPDERAVIGGPVADFCGRFARDPETPSATARLRAYGLYGLGTESFHGGAGLSAIAQAAAFGQLSAGAGSAVALRVGGATRLAWTELLRRHGTPAQQSQFLPRLAQGAVLQADEVRLAGDAQIGEGPDGLALILTLDLDLAADAELVGILVDVRDPKARLPREAGTGPTLLLLEAGRLRANLRGVTAPFDAVIGERERIGKAAADASECRAVADAIAPAAIHAGAATALALAAGSAARLRAPFAARLGERALAQEALAALAARAYAAQALAAATARAVDLGEKPLGPAAFARTLALLQARRCVAAAHDLGLERSALQRLIASLEEVGNDAPEPPMLTRPDSYSACVLRSHNAFMQALIAANTANPAQALERFDAALWSHVGHLCGSAARAFALALGAGSRLFGGGAEALAMRRINRYSAALAFAADVSLSLLGSELASRKPYTALRGVREASRRTLTTWLGDALAQLYLASAALRQFDQGGANPAERALLDLICTEAFGAVEEALDRLLRHLSSPTLSWLTRLIVLPLGHSRLAPSEATQRSIAAQLQQTDSPLRERLALRSGLPADATPWPLLDAALAAARGLEAVEQRAAAATAQAASRHAPTRIALAESAAAITTEEAAQLRAWLAAFSAFEAFPADRISS